MPQTSTVIVLSPDGTALAAEQPEASARALFKSTSFHDGDFSAWWPDFASSALTIRRLREPSSKTIRKLALKEGEDVIVADFTTKILTYQSPYFDPGTLGLIDLLRSFTHDRDRLIELAGFGAFRGCVFHAEDVNGYDADRSFSVALSPTCAQTLLHPDFNQYHWEDLSVSSLCRMVGTVAPAGADQWITSMSRGRIVFTTAWSMIPCVADQIQELYLQLGTV